MNLDNGPFLSFIFSTKVQKFFFARIKVHKRSTLLCLGFILDGKRLVHVLNIHNKPQKKQKNSSEHSVVNDVEKYLKEKQHNHYFFFLFFEIRFSDFLTT